MLVADQLLHKAGHLGAGLALHPEHRIGVCRNKARHKNGERCQRYDHQRDAPVYIEHDPQGTQNGQHAGKQLGKSHQQAVTELLHIGRDAADRIAGTVGVHIFQWQNLKLLKHAHPHIPHDLKGDSVVDNIHQPLGERRAGNRGSHSQCDAAKPLIIYLPGPHDLIDRPAGQHRCKQGGDNGDERQCKRKNDHALVGADQLQNALDRIAVKLLRCLAHSVLATSSLLSWLRQISL